MFTRGSFANAFVSFLVAALLTVQGLVVTGGNVAYATGEDGTMPNDTRTEVVNWSDAEHESLFGQCDVEATSQLALDTKAVKEMNLTEDAFRALVNDERATVPANVDLTVNLMAPEDWYFIAGDTITFPANTDDDAVQFENTTSDIALTDPNDSTKELAKATIADGVLTIKLLESAFDAAEADEPSVPSVG